MERVNAWFVDGTKAEADATTDRTAKVENLMVNEVKIQANYNRSDATPGVSRRVAGSSPTACNTSGRETRIADIRA